MCGVWRGYDVAGVGGGEFALRLASRQKVAPLYWRSDTHTHTHTHAPPYFLHRMHGFLEARCSWEPGSRLTTRDFSPFRLSPKVSGANVHWANSNHTFLTHKNPRTDTFLRDISPATLRSTAQVRNPQGIFKLVNKVDCRVPCALLKAIVQAFLATKSFAAGSSRYPCHMACISKPVPKDVISLSDCRPQWLRSTMDVTCDCRG
jgi:hypothetical protein